MKKKTLKIIVLLAAILLSAVSCGRADEANGNTVNKIQTQNGRESESISSWCFERTILEDFCELATIKDGKIYSCHYTTDGLIISEQDIKTGEKEKSYKISYVTEIRNITVDSQNQICLFGATENGNTLWQVCQDGTINIIDNIVTEDIGLYPLSKGFFADNNGHYYLWYEMSVPCAEVYENGEENI